MVVPFQSLGSYQNVLWYLNMPLIEWHFWDKLVVVVAGSLGEEVEESVVGAVVVGNLEEEKEVVVYLEGSLVESVVVWLAEFEVDFVAASVVVWLVELVMV